MDWFVLTCRGKPTGNNGFICHFVQCIYRGCNFKKQMPSNLGKTSSGGTYHECIMICPFLNKCKKNVVLMSMKLNKFDKTWHAPVYEAGSILFFRRVFPCKDVPYRFPIRGAFCSVLCYLLIIYTLKTKTNIGIYPRHMASPPTSTFLEWPVTKLLGMGTTWNCKIWETECRASDKHTKNYGKSPFLVGKSTISMAIVTGYVKLPESMSLQRLFQQDLLAWWLGHRPSATNSPGWITHRVFG